MISSNIDSDARCYFLFLLCTFFHVCLIFFPQRVCEIQIWLLKLGE